jgi:hypothetical protein
MSDFKHVQQSLSRLDKNCNNIEQPPEKKPNPRAGIVRQDSITTKKDKFQKMLKRKVMENTSQDIKSTVLAAHSKMDPGPHSDVTSRVGENSFLANKHRMEEVVEAKEIQYLEENKWIISVIDLVKGLASKRKQMAAKDREKVPPTPNEVFLFIACLLRIILAGWTIDREMFNLILQKVLAKNLQLYNDVVTNQVITLVRTCLEITTKQYCDFLTGIGIQVTDCSIYSHYLFQV